MEPSYEVPVANPTGQMTHLQFTVEYEKKVGYWLCCTPVVIELHATKSKQLQHRYRIFVDERTRWSPRKPNEHLHYAREQVANKDGPAWDLLQKVAFSVGAELRSE